MSAKINENEVDPVECPLCMEPLDFDDLGFYPCPCGYQICRFCWHRLANLEDDSESGKGKRGLCPACRQEYPEAPVCFNSGVSIEAMLEQVKNKKKKKKQASKQRAKQQEEKQKLKEILKREEKNLSGFRVVQKNLVFVIGLPTRLTQDEIRKEFGKYGKIFKLVIGNTNSNMNTAYVTYNRAQDAIKAIQMLNNHGRSKASKSAVLTVKASLGTTKYCTHFLKNQQCPKLPDCMYLHDLADPEASFTKEDMQEGKHTEYERKLITQYFAVKEKENVNSKKKQLKNPIATGEGVRILTAQPSSSVFTGRGRSVEPESEVHTKRPDSASSDSKMQLNSLDDIIGNSSDSLSTSYSTCSSGSSCPPSISPPSNQDDLEPIGIQTSDYGLQKEAPDQGMMSHSPGIASDDDGLDFDPISVSTTGLEDMIRNDHSEGLYNSNPVAAFPYRDKYNSETDQQRNVEQHLWRDSLKALLPNVKITFAGSSNTASNTNGVMDNQSLPPFRKAQQPNMAAFASLPSQMVARNNFVRCPTWFQNQHQPPQMPPPLINQLQSPQRHPPLQQHHLQHPPLQRLFNCVPTDSVGAMGVGHQPQFVRQTLNRQPPPGFANF